ncbi:MAG: hypothetical protein P8J18_06710, partial [Halieaceae bacterium]|nr:hypothetical protein [Halieaceae bacterium]
NKHLSEDCPLIFPSSQDVLLAVFIAHSTPSNALPTAKETLSATSQAISFVLDPVQAISIGTGEITLGSIQRIGDCILPASTTLPFRWRFNVTTQILSSSVVA